MTQPLDFMGSPSAVKIDLPKGPAPVEPVAQVAPPAPAPEEASLPPLPEAEGLPPLPSEQSSAPSRVESPVEDAGLPPLPSEVELPPLPTSQGLPPLPGTQAEDVETTAPEAFMLGAVDMGTFSFGDELAGGMDWLLDKAYGVSAKNLELVQKGFALHGATSGEEVYRQGQQEMQARIKAAQEQHPAATLAGGITGAILLPGISGLKVAKGLGTAGKLAVGAVEGGLAGAGASTALVLPGHTTTADVAKMAEDVAYGMAFGTAGAGLLTGAGAAIRKLKGPARLADPDVVEDATNALSHSLTKLKENAHEIETMSSIVTNPNFRASDDLLETFTRTMSNLNGATPARLEAEAGKAVKELKPKFVAKMEARATKIREERIVEAAKSAIPDTPQILEVVEDAPVSLSRVLYEADPLKAMVKELASKGVTVDKKEAAAFLEVMKDKQGFYNYLSPKNAHSVKQLETGAVNPVSYVELENSLRKQGLLTERSYQEYRTAKYLQEAVETKVQTVLSKSDPTSTLSYFENLRFAVRAIDNSAGTGIEPYIEELQHKVAEHHGFILQWHKKLQPLLAEGRASGMPAVDITKALESAEYRTSLTTAQQSVIQKYQGVFKDFRSAANAKGLDIGDLENYAPMSSKRGPDLIIAVRNRAKELGGAGLDDVDQVSSDRVFHAATDYSAAAVADASPGTKALAEYKAVVAHMFGVDITSMRDLKKYSEALFDNTKVRTLTKKSLGYEAAVAFTRDGVMPDFIREYDVERLFNNMVVNTSKGIHLTAPLKYIEAHIPILQSAGMKDSARYLTNYVADMSGQASRKTGKLQDWSMQYQLWAKDTLTGGASKAAQMVPEVFGFLGQQIYPNLLGFNVKNLLQNVTQPFLMGASGMARGKLNAGSMTYGYKKATAATVATAKDLMVMHPLKALDTFLEREGFPQPEMGSRSLAHLEEASRISRHPVAQARYDKFMGAGLLIFNKSDKIAKVMSIKMADSIIDDFLSATAKKGVNLLADETNAMGAISMVPRSLRRRIEFANPAEARKLLRNYYVSETNLVYGKVGATQFAREWGPIASMFSTWPTTVASDIASKFRERGLQRGMAIVAEKYFGPAFALSMVNNAIQPKDQKSKTRYQAAVGPAGLGGISPIYSLGGLTTIGHTPVVDTAISAVTGISGLGDIASGDVKTGTTKMKKAVQDSLKLYMPGMSYWNFAKRIDTMVDGKKPK